MGRRIPYEAVPILAEIFHLLFEEPVVGRQPRKKYKPEVTHFVTDTPVRTKCPVHYPALVCIYYIPDHIILLCRLSLFTGHLFPLFFQ